MTETWSDNRLSVPVYPDEDYNIPYNSPAASLSSQQALDLALRSSKVPSGLMWAPIGPLAHSLFFTIADLSSQSSFGGAF